MPKPIPWICDRDGTEITDCPDIDNRGYVADKPAVAKDGSIKPSSERTLCKAHYLEEHAEVYPDAGSPLPE